MLNFDLLILILGFVLVVEGMPWFLSPTKAKRAMAQLFVLDDRTLRILGLALMLAGLGLVYLIRG
ncbi:MAG: DUF2065 domain-containing protein [Deltaproteobacteria bacterium]|jgi:uncharacterized protein YjeT (DUF2065 family)|nr:DUF2065 domain-containing protein [Deltaproteobacteria bacterium]